MRLTSVTPFLHFGYGSHFDGIGDGHVMGEEAARFDPLDVTGDVRRMAHSDVSPLPSHIHPGAGLPAMPFPANILNQVVPDANLASANVLG